MLSSEVATITPPMAEAWLARNKRNRHLAPWLVDRYAKAMGRGEWRLNGDPIRFDEVGDLLDGQHRLAAIVKSGITVESVVLRGIPAITQDTMDTGRKRTIADVLALRGEAHAIPLAAALNTLHKLETDAWRANATPTAQQALALLNSHPGLRASVPVGERTARRVPGLAGGITAALHYHFSGIDDAAEADAKDFFERLASGADLDEDSPILTLRRTFGRLHAERGHASAVRMTALVILAWNAYRDGRPLKLLRWSPGGSRPDSFPQAH